MARKTLAHFVRMPLVCLGLVSATSAVAVDARFITSVDDARYRAVGKLAHASGGCTASVVAGSADPEPALPALVVTAGHCVNGNKDIANEVRVNEPPIAGLHFTPAFFKDSQAAHAPVPVTRLLYATTKGVDIAILRLAATYGELAAAGIRPLVPGAPSVIGTLPVELAHIPVGGVAPDEQFLRLSVCQTYEPGVVMEGDWLFTQASRTNCAAVAPGSSGAPVLREGTSEVIGIMSTQASTERHGCGLHRPCELTARVPVSRDGATYQSLMAPLVAAFRADGSWDGSSLDQGDGVKLQRTGPEFTRSEVQEGAEVVPARWGVVVEGDTHSVRFKAGDTATINCADESGYSEPVLASEQPFDRLPVGPEEGAYALCVVGQKRGDDQWQQPVHASVIQRVIDDTRPTFAPAVAVFKEDETVWQVRVSSPFKSSFVKGGRLATTDCDADAGYKPLTVPVVVLPKAKAPLRLCARGTDEAGNMSPVGVLELGN